MRLTAMWVRLLVVGTVLAVGSATVAAAQGTAGGRPAAGTPRRDAAKKRLENATPEQKAWAKTMMQKRQELRAAVNAGTMDRKSAAAALKEWRTANPAPKKPAKPAP